MLSFLSLSSGTYRGGSLVCEGANLILIIGNIINVLRKSLCCNEFKLEEEFPKSQS